MTDPRLATLAAALDEALSAADDEWTVSELADLILAALPPDWCGHDPHEAFDAKQFAAVVMQRDRAEADVADKRAEIARLRKIEEAARAVHDRYSEDVRLAPSWLQMAALRAALDGSER